MMAERTSKLQIVERQVGDITVLALSGEIRADAGDLALGHHVDDLIRRKRVNIVVNLSDVTYIDSSGVGMMLAKMKMVRTNGGALKLACLVARSHHLVAMLKLKLVFEIFDDEAAAVDSFSSGLPL
jgi:anti-sigma B factor antagonist